MSIASAITDLQDRIENAYDSIEDMGGTIPATKNSYNLPTAIESIPTGSQPAYGIDGVGVVGAIVNGSIAIPSEKQSCVLSGLTKINNTNLQYMFYYNKGIESVSFPDLTSITTTNALNYFGRYSYIKHFSMDAIKTLNTFGSLRLALANSYAIEDVSFANLETIEWGGGMSQFCQNNTTLKNVYFPKLKFIGDMSNSFTGPTSTLNRTLTSVSFPELIEIDSTAMNGSFSYCVSLSSISLPKLKTIGNSGMTNCFNGAAGTQNTSLTSISFPELTSIGDNGMQGSFLYCKGIQSISFPKLTTIGNYAFRGGMQMGHPNSVMNSITFPELTALPLGAFAQQFNNGGMMVGVQRYVRNLYFPKVTSIVGSSSVNLTETTLCGFQNISGENIQIYLASCNSITNNYLFTDTQKVTLHFASANQSAIEATTGYATKWGASSSSQVLFDL